MQLSIIIPVYNTQKYLKQCIDSVLNQTFQDTEIILVDDGSTDESGQICDEYATRRNVKIIHQNNEGLLKARVEGVKRAKGEYITFVDSDDWIDHRMYEEMLRNLDSDIDLIVSGIIRYYNEQKKVYQYTILENCILEREEIQKRIFKTMIWDFNINACGFDPSLCCKIFKKNLLLPYLEQAVNLDIYLGEDAAVIYPFMQGVKRLKSINKCYYFHRQRTGNEVASYISEDRFFHNLYKFYNYLIEHLDDQFMPQIEMYYLKMLNLRKRYYLNIVENDMVYFPIDIFEQDSKFVLYGAGNYGNRVYELYKKTGMGRLVMWVDKNYQLIQRDVPILPPSNIDEAVYDYILIAVCSALMAEEIRIELVKMNIPKEKIIWKKEQQISFSI